MQEKIEVNSKSTELSFVAYFKNYDKDIIKIKYSVIKEKLETY